MSRATGSRVLFFVALAVAVTSFVMIIVKHQLIETKLVQISSSHKSNDTQSVTTKAESAPHSKSSAKLVIQHEPPQTHRRLQQKEPTAQSAIPRPEIHGKTVEGPPVSIQMFCRARERVSDSDVPFLLEVPHTGSDTIYNILKTCYGLKGKRYLDSSQLARDKELGAVDKFYVSAHERPPDNNDYFHFVSSPHYQEVSALFSFEHRGRVVLMTRHPCVIAESMYLALPGSVQGDVKGLLKYTTSPDYYDNWMTRMIANVPPSRAVTEQDFVEARLILENKFLIGMTSDMAETVMKRIKLYFGWKELPNHNGCEMEYINKAISRLPPTSLVDGSHEWREIRKRNHYDMKLYARSMFVFGHQKMGMPVHQLVSEEEKRVVKVFVQNLRDKTEPVDDLDIPFFWHIPKASGTTVKETLSDCYGLVRTEMIRPPSSLDIIGSSKVLNVDLSTSGAVAVAKEMNLAEKGLADVFISQIVEAGIVFTPERKGRAFTIMRHPVKLAASLFYYRRKATWEPTYRPEYNDITLDEYVNLEGYYDNWMVRMLTNAKLGRLNRDHLELAKSIIKEKFVVGISDHMENTFHQFENYFGWKENKKGCVEEHLQRSSNKNKYPELERGGPVWEVIADRNKFDMALYYYALELFGTP